MNSSEFQADLLAIPPYSMWHEYWLYWKREKRIAILAHAITVVGVTAMLVAVSLSRKSINQGIADRMSQLLSHTEEALGRNHLSDARVALAKAQGESNRRVGWIARADDLLGISTPLSIQQKRLEKLRTRIQAEVDTDSFLQTSADADWEIIGDYWRLLPHEDPTGRKAIVNPAERSADLHAGLAAAEEAASRFGLPDLTRIRQLESEGLSEETAQQVRDRAGELLFLWAIALERVNQGQPDPIHDEALHEAVRLLTAAEDLGFQAKMLYAFRGRFRDALGDKPGADADRQRASGMPPSTFYDHHILAAACRDAEECEKEIYHYHLALSERPGDRWTLFRLATALERSSDGTQAAAAYQRLITVEPENATLRNNLGNLLLKLGRLEEAERELRKAVEVQGDYFMAYTNLVLLYAESKRVAQAQEVCEQLLQRDIPARVASHAHNNLGLAYERVGQDSLALTHYEKACDLSPDDANAHRNYAVALLKAQRFSDAKRAIDHAIRVAPAVANLYVIQGDILAEEARSLEEQQDDQAAERNYELSIAAFTEAIQRDASGSSLKDAHYNRGVIRRRLGRLADAFDDQSKVVTLSGGYDRNAVYELAMNYIHDRQWRLAAGMLDQIVTRDPHDAKALLTRGRVLSDRGTPQDLEQSERDLDQFIDLAQDVPEGYRARGLTRFRREDWTGAIEDWREYLRLAEHAPDRSAILAETGTAFFNLRQFEEALRFYSLSIRSSELTPSVSVLGNRANAYLRTGNLEKAIEDCSRVIESNADPTMPGVASTLARVLGLRAEAYLREGRTMEAIRDLTESLKLQDMYESRVVRGVASYLIGDHATALADLNNVIEHATQHNPSSPRLVFARGMHELLHDRLPQAVAELSRVPAEAPLDQFAIGLRAGAWLKIGGPGLRAALNDASTMLDNWPNEEFAESNALRVYEELVQSEDAALAAEARTCLERLRSK